MIARWMTPLRLFAALPLAGLLLSTGCANYRLGSTLPAHLESIAVPTFANTSGEPQIESMVTRAVLQDFQRDGTLSIANADKADIVLNGTVVGYSLEPVRYERDNPKAAQEYRLVLRAAIQGIERSTGKMIIDTAVEGDTTFRAVGDITTAKRGALPGAARDLAHEITNAVLSAW